jgi:uncharacterized membrane protein YfcA
MGIVAAVFLLAGLVKGVVGLGCRRLSMGLLAGVMPPAQAAVMLILPSLLTNAWQMWDGAALAGLVRRLWPLQLGVSPERCGRRSAWSRSMRGLHR